MILFNPLTQLLAALLLDCLLGDPRWLPHPVRAIGWLAGWTETFARRHVRHERLAGILAWCFILGCTLGFTRFLLLLACRLGTIVEWLAGAVVIYFCIAARDLGRHAWDVSQALTSDNLPEARRRVGLIVSRDTTQLDQAGVTRAAVESVAENLVDGITAPLFFAALFGPLGAIVYRAINTLDAMFGYKNDRYLLFGWASARADDVANWLPARLTVPFLFLAARMSQLNANEGWRILRRDAARHASPNSGLPESFAAGALGVQLGGPSVYFGKLTEKPTLGDPTRPIETIDILRSLKLIYAAVAMFFLLSLLLRWVVT